MRPEARIEVDEAPRLSGRFNLDHVAQEHMNVNLEAWTPPEPVRSMRNLEANRIRPIPSSFLARSVTDRLGWKDRLERKLN